MQTCPPQTHPYHRQINAPHPVFTKINLWAPSTYNETSINLLSTTSCKIIIIMMIKKKNKKKIINIEYILIFYCLKLHQPSPATQLAPVTALLQRRGEYPTWFGGRPRWWWWDTPRCDANGDGGRCGRPHSCQLHYVYWSSLFGLWLMRWPDMWVAVVESSLWGM